MKMEELHLQELKLNRELIRQKEEVKHLQNIISEYERTINNLEEEIVQQKKVCISVCYEKNSIFLILLSDLKKKDSS